MACNGLTFNSGNPSGCFGGNSCIWTLVIIAVILVWINCGCSFGCGCGDC